MKTIEEIIVNKSFDELNASEKLLIKDLASNEQEFLHTKSLLQSVATLSQTEIIRPSVKTNLDSIFNSKFQLPHTQMVMEKSVPRILPFYNTLWFRAAAVFVIGVGVAAPIYLSSTKVLEGESKNVAQLEKVETKTEGEKSKTESNTSSISRENDTKTASLQDVTSANSISSEDQSSITRALPIKNGSTTKAKKAGKVSSVDGLAGLPMFKRKSPDGGFVFTSAVSKTIVPELTLSAANPGATYFYSNTANSGEISTTQSQPETTDQMLDIIQSVY